MDKNASKEEILKNYKKLNTDSLKTLKELTPEEIKSRIKVINDFPKDIKDIYPWEDGNSKHSFIHKISERKVKRDDLYRISLIRTLEVRYNSDGTVFTITIHTYDPYGYLKDVWTKKGKVVIVQGDEKSGIYSSY